jgi:elongation factor P
MTVTTSELRKGLTIQLDGDLYKVTDWAHNKQGRGSAQVRLQLKNLRTGTNIERTFQAGAKFDDVRLERRQLQYMYADGDTYNFMDPETFEQSTLSANQLGDAVNYMRESDTVDILMHGDDFVDIDMPAAVVLTITHSDPGVRGDTATGATKPATLETGLTVQVPLFVNTTNRLEGLDHEERLAVLDRPSVLDEDSDDPAAELGLDLVHHLHRLDDTHDRVRLNLLVLRYVWRLVGSGGGVEGADHWRYNHLLAVLEGDFAAVGGAVANQVNALGAVGRGEGGWRGIDGWSGVGGSRDTAPLDDDAHSAALQVQLIDVGTGDEAHKLFDLVAERGESGQAIVRGGVVRLALALLLLLVVRALLRQPYHSPPR